MKTTIWMLIVATIAAIIGGAYHLHLMISYESSLRMVRDMKLDTPQITGQMNRWILGQLLDVVAYWGIAILTGLTIFRLETKIR